MPYSDPANKAAAQRRYAAAHPDRIKESRDRHKTQNPELVKASDKRYREKNENQIKMKKKEWGAKNRAKLSQAAAAYRLRKRVIGFMPPNSYRAVVEFYGKCLFPKCDENKNLHIDHVISLSGGGIHDISNLQVLCQYHNISKHAKSIDYRNGEIVIDVDENGQAVLQ
jgi:5-methylcytosine-specific restriction endonuclease McrA